MLSKYFIIISLALLQGCQSSLPEQNSKRDEFNKMISQTVNSPHHWGQEGQNRPNNGWSEYGYLKVELEKDNYAIVNQKGNEFLIDIYSLATKKKEWRALSIRGVGVFYQPKEIHTSMKKLQRRKDTRIVFGTFHNLDGYACLPDKIENAGLLLETAMYYLSELYPNGPGGSINNSSIPGSNSPVTLQFLQAHYDLTPEPTEASVITSGDGKHNISLNIGGPDKRWLVQWEEEARETVPSSEDLSEWLACWKGITFFDENRKESFAPKISNIKGLQTFGKVRQQIEKSANK